MLLSFDWTIFFKYEKKEKMNLKQSDLTELISGKIFIGSERIRANENFTDKSTRQIVTFAWFSLKVKR